MCTILNIFDIKEEYFKTVAKIFNKTGKSLNEDVEYLRKWIKRQQFSPILDYNTIRNFLILNKCNVEKSKIKIENYYKIRSTITCSLGDVNPRLLSKKKLSDLAYFVPYPQLTEDLHRIFYVKIKNSQLLDKFELIEGMQNFFILQELRLRDDIFYGDIFVLDCKGATVSFGLKFTPIFFYKICLLIYGRIFSFRCKVIYLINVQPFVVRILDSLKRFVKAKLAQKIHLAPDEKYLLEVLPPDLIPEDYGGEGFSLSEIEEALNRKIQENLDFFDHLDTIQVKENRKPKHYRNEFSGVQGCFKKLNID